MTTKLRRAINKIFHDKKIVPSAGGQMCGSEIWSIKVTGHAEGDVYAALHDTEYENHKLKVQITNVKSALSDLIKAIEDDSKIDIVKYDDVLGVAKRMEKG